MNVAVGSLVGAGAGSIALNGGVSSDKESLGGSVRLAGGDVHRDAPHGGSTAAVITVEEELTRLGVRREVFRSSVRTALIEAEMCKSQQGGTRRRGGERRHGAPCSAPALPAAS